MFYELAPSLMDYRCPAVIFNNVEADHCHFLEQRKIHLIHISIIVRVMSSLTSPHHYAKYQLPIWR